MSTMSLRSNNDEENCARNRILHAAGAIFAEKGFRCATVRDICESAEVNIASVNYYFGDKKTLYEQTLLLAREIGAQKFPTPNFSELQNPHHRLRSIILLLLNRLVGNHVEPWPVKLMMSEILAPSPAAKPLIDGYIDPFLKMVFQTVKEMVHPHASNACVHQLSFSVISQCVWYRFASDVNRMVISETQYAENFSVNILAKQILEFSLAGIAAVNTSVNTSANADLDAAFQPVPKHQSERVSDQGIESVTVPAKTSFSPVAKHRSTSTNDGNADASAVVQRRVSPV